MPGINPFPERLPDDKAEDLARRRTAKLKEQAGMFAEYVEPVTVEQVQAGVREHHERFASMLVVHEERAARFREEAERHLTVEQLAEEERRLAAYPTRLRTGPTTGGRC